MINLELKNHSNSFNCGSFKFASNTVNISNNFKSDLLLALFEIEKFNLVLTAFEDKLYLENIESSTEVLVNNKFMTGRKTLKINDIVTIDCCEIKIVDFKETEINLSSQKNIAEVFKFLDSNLPPEYKSQNQYKILKEDFNIK